MIARSWSATTRPDREKDYLRTVREKVLPHLRNVDGYRGCFFARRREGGHWRYLVVTYWESMDSLRALAGDNPERAYVPPEIRSTLEELDETAENFEVVLQDGDGPAR